MQKLGKYRLDQMLGQGGMGAVYRSFHPQLNRPVAIKVMLGSIAADPQAGQRFMREAQVVAALSHPHIVNIFDVDEDDGRPYIVMDFIAGGSLAEQLRAGALPPDEAIQLLIPLVDALEYAHRQGVVHRDLKPANVLLHPSGGPVLADFGLARPVQAATEARITATGTVLGTLAYMAPEQFSGGPVDGRTDIYALGAMLFEMLTGRPPFEGDTAQLLYGHMQLPPPAPRSLNPNLPDALERLVLRMLAKDPAQRPQSAAEVAAALRSIQGGAAENPADGAATGPTIALERPVAPQWATDAPGDQAVAESVPPQQVRRRMLLALLAVIAIVSAGVFYRVLSLAPSGTAQGGTPMPTMRPTQPAATRDLEADPTRPAAGAATARPAEQPVIAVDPQRLAGRFDATLAGPFEQVTGAELRQVVSSGPESFSVGNLSYGRVNKSIWFFGDVRNDGAEPREAVEVRINLLDQAGQEIVSDTGYAQMSYLNPGEVAPFLVLFTDDEAPPQVASITIEVRSRKADFELGYTLRDLSIDGDLKVTTGQFGELKISGQVRNDSAEPIKFPQVYAVFYDAAGAVVGIDDSFAETTGDEQSLPPGQGARFEISWQIFNGEPARYRLFAEGNRL